MKKLWWLGFSVIGLLVLVTSIFGCAFGWRGFLRDTLSGNSESFEKNYRWAGLCGGRLLGWWDKVPELLDNTYIVLLQNNTELRPTGGFMGSYARVVFVKGALKDVVVQDIYQPDGQIPGHVEPPYPIQESFRQGWWRLRDANWDPDFPRAAEAVRWFLVQGKEDPVDGVVAVNLDLLRKWIEVLGQVKVITYDKLVTADNLYQLAQSEAEVGWVPGSTQKRDFLGALGTAVLGQTKSADMKTTLNLAQLVLSELEAKQILLWMDDDVAQKEVVNLGWAGELMRESNDNYLYIVEANLGANKANCCVTRKVRQEISDSLQKVQVTWANDNEFTHPLPPVFWGGQYRNYVRVVVPKGEIKEVRVGDRILRRSGPEDFTLPNSLRQEISEDMFVVEERGNLMLVGFWTLVPAKSELEVGVTYSLEKADTKILVRRQPGIDGFRYELIVNGRIVADEKIVRDKYYDY